MPCIFSNSLAARPFPAPGLMIKAIPFPVEEIMRYRDCDPQIYRDLGFVKYEIMANSPFDGWLVLFLRAENQFDICIAKLRG